MNSKATLHMVALLLYLLTLRCAIIPVRGDTNQSREEALEEIKIAVAYYNKQSKGLGTRFKNNLLAEIAAIKERPLSRSARYEDVRFAVVKKFPYAAHYTVDEQLHLVKIQAVLAFKQDDKANWKQRF